MKKIDKDPINDLLTQLGSEATPTDIHAAILASKASSRRCKRCKTTSYTRAVAHNAVGEVIRCSICSEDPMLLARYAQECFDEAQRQMYEQLARGHHANPEASERGIKACEGRFILDRYPECLTTGDRRGSCVKSEARQTLPALYKRCETCAS